MRPIAAGLGRRLKHKSGADESGFALEDCIAGGRAVPRAVDGDCPGDAAGDHQHARDGRDRPQGAAELQPAGDHHATGGAAGHSASGEPACHTRGDCAGRSTDSRRATSTHASHSPSSARNGDRRASWCGLGQRRAAHRGKSVAAAGASARHCGCAAHIQPGRASSGIVTRACGNSRAVHQPLPAAMVGGRARASRRGNVLFVVAASSPGLGRRRRGVRSFCRSRTNASAAPSTSAAATRVASARADDPSSSQAGSPRSRRNRRIAPSPVAGDRGGAAALPHRGEPGGDRV